MAHVTDVGLELLPPEQVTSSHVTVAPPGFSCFGLVQAVASRAALRGLVVLFRQRSTRALFVLLLPSNINLGQVGPGHAHSHPGHTHSLTHKHTSFALGAVNQTVPPVSVQLHHPGPAHRCRRVTCSR